MTFPENGSNAPASASAPKPAANVEDPSYGMVVSVVIPTRNRSNLLSEAIEALLAQTYDPRKFEIIVVDNLSTDDTPGVVEELSRRAPCDIRYHRMEENKGPANSRNKGAELARGELIAFTDSDCRPALNWLELGVAAFDRREVGLATGSVLYKPEQKVTFFSRAVGETRTEHPSYPTANAWYRRSVFLELGGFDIDLCFVDFLHRPVECADTDLAWRVKEAGHSNVFLTDMVVYHEVETLPPVRWAFEPFRCFVVPELVRRHPQIRDVLLVGKVFFFKENVLFYLAVLGLLLAPFTHWAVALLALPFIAWAALAGRQRFSPAVLVKMVPRVLLIGARHAALCGGLLYGSVRFRALVL